MSHWHRAPRTIPVRTLLLHRKQRFFLDYGLPFELMQNLIGAALPNQNFSLAEGLTRLEVAKVCQQKRGTLITADPEYVPLLCSVSRSGWGIILLPSDESVWFDVLRRLAAGGLLFRPYLDQTGMGEYARRNRTLLDLRPSHPVLSVYSNCRWLAESE